MNTKNLSSAAMAPGTPKWWWVSDGLADKISFYHLALLLLSLPFDMFYSHLILVSFILHTLIHLKKAEIKPLLTMRNLALQSVFFLTVLGTIYSSNKPEAFTEWGKQVTILLFPVIFCLNPISIKQHLNKLLLIFATGLTLVILGLFAEALRTIHFYHLPLNALFSAGFSNHNFAEPIEMHATFFSMQVALALVYFVSVLLRSTSNTHKIFVLICCAILTAGMVQLGSKSVFVALLIILNFGIPYFLLKGKQRLRYIVATLSLSALIIAGIWHIDNFKERYVTDLKTDLSKATPDELFDPRLARWQIALDLVKQKPVFGYGSGTEISLLNDQFYQHKFYRSFLAKLNAHNEFLSMLIKTGVIGLLVYLATLYFGFRQAFRNHSLLLFAFMVIITAVSFSENYLDVDKGIIYYGLFFSLLVFAEGLAPSSLRGTKTIDHRELINTL